jgi:hypothetical protein
LSSWPARTNGPRIRAAGRERVVVYIARPLLAVAARGDLWHLPEWIRCRFIDAEGDGAPAHECERLTPELFEVICEKAGKAIAGNLAADVKEQIAERLAEVRRLGLQYGAVLPGQCVSYDANRSA